MPRYKAWFLVFTCSFMLLCSAPAARGQSGAAAVVHKVLDDAMNVQTRPDLKGAEHRKERAELVRKLISQNFMTREMAQESLKSHWGKLSAKERSQYQSLFVKLFIDSYTRRVLDFLGKEKVEYPGETPEGRSVRVKTVIMRPNEHIPVDYMVSQAGRGWMIKDVIIDGVSTVETYQGSFDRFLRAHPFSALIHSMQIQAEAEGGL